MEGRLKVYLIVFDQYQGDGRLLSEWGQYGRVGGKRVKGRGGGGGRKELH